MSEGTLRFPMYLRLAGHEVSLRYMRPSDRLRMHAFAKVLPGDDLLFLRRDITEERQLDEWLRDVADGLATTLLAEISGQLVGYGALQRSTLRWTDHVADMRLMVAPAWRGIGIGGLLAREVFRIAVSEGLLKVVGQLAAEQTSAIATMESLGFRPEAILRGHVRDRAGNPHDLLLFSRDMRHYAEQQHLMGMAEVLGS